MIRRLRIIGLCLAAAFVVAATVGCPSSVEEGFTEVPEPAGEDAIEPSDDVYEFAWTDEPEVGQIPSGPIIGMLNGESFEAELVRVRKTDEDTYQLEVLNKGPDGDDLTGVVMGADAWQLRFSRPEGETGTVQWTISDEKEFEFEHVYYYYDQGEDRGPMSVNYPWGAALEIAEWNLAEDGENERILGNITGRIALVMNDDESSWAAGEFDAIYYEW